MCLVFEGIEDHAKSVMCLVFEGIEDHANSRPATIPEGSILNYFVLVNQEHAKACKRLHHKKVDQFP